MATIREIYNVLFDFAPADMKLDWDNVGLACGHFDAEVHKILVALDPMPDVFEEAKARSCELVVTHHPLLFQGVKQVNSDTYAGNCLLYLIENSIAAMNLHTNLDCCPGGVNDVLALKDANCGIAMASGSQAASQVAQIVLLNSQFSAMPAIVAEGRRVINNIQRAASLFLVKNIFSFALTLLLLFIDMPYPLLPIQLSLISTFTIGIPSFFLALEPNYARVEGKFMRNVIRRAMPGGLTNLTIVLLAGFFTSTFGLSNEQLNTICVWVMSAVGLVTLYHVSVPFTRLRLAVLAAMTAAMLFSLLVIPAFFDLPALNASSALILVTLLLACPTVMRFFRVIFDKRVAKLDLAPAKKQKKRHRFEK